MARKIDKRTALRLLTKVVAEQPTKTAVCFYVKDGKPECVAGVLMHNVGVDISAIPNDTFPALVDATQTEDHTFSPERANLVRKAFGDVKFTKGAARLIGFIQALQDDRLTVAVQVVVPYDDTSDSGYQQRKALMDSWESLRTETVPDENGYSDTRLNWTDALAITVEHYSKF